MEASLNLIKNNYAQEHGYEDWADLYQRAGYYDETEFFKHEDAVFILAQKAALEKAAENVTSGSFRSQSDYIITCKDITNPENIIR